MKRTVGPMHRYGEPDFDTDYITWGFHGTETQLQEAESVLRIKGAAKPIRILDIACGTGHHAIRWAQEGHDVTGVDVSKVFTAQGKEMAEENGVKVSFVVDDIRLFSADTPYDLVTWISGSFFDRSVAEKIRQLTAEGGLFITDVRNPEHPRTKSRLQSNWRSWREEEGVFYLERHETNEATGMREDVWITIDPKHDTIEEKRNVGHRTLSPDELTALLRSVGFEQVELRTMEGEIFAGGPEPYWLWAVARGESLL